MLQCSTGIVNTNILIFKQYYLNYVVVNFQGKCREKQFEMWDLVRLNLYLP